MENVSIHDVESIDVFKAGSATMLGVSCRNNSYICELFRIGKQKIYW